MGFWSAVEGHLHRLIRESRETLAEETKSAIVSFEWLTHVHKLFNNILVSIKTIVIAEENVGVIKKQIKRVLNTLNPCATGNLSVETLSLKAGRKLSCMFVIRGATSGKIPGVLSSAVGLPLNTQEQIVTWCLSFTVSLLLTQVQVL